MMRCLLFLFIFISSQFCYGQSSSSAVLCPKLDSLLCKYIKTSNNDNNSIHLTFMEYGGAEFLMFDDDSGYDSRFTDGYFYKQGRLITYYSFNLKDWRKFIDSSAAITYRDSIPDYNDNGREDGVFMISNGGAPQKLYLLRSPSEILEVSNVYSCPDVKWERASDTNVINSPKLNKILNDYINDNYHILYAIRFNKIGREYFISINGAFAYDDRMINGYFYRNGHLVVLYGLEDLPYQDMIATNEVLKFNGSIDNYRGVRRLIPEFQNLPLPIKLKIVSREKFKKVSYKRRDWLSI